MKKIMLVLTVFCSLAAYADDDCPSAAEAAESQNPEKYKHCDYTKEGLNGILHRAWQNSSDKTETKPTPENTEAQQQQIKADKKAVSESEFSNAQQLQALRFALIQKATLECTKGFVLDGEKFVPTTQKTFHLEYIYHCL